MKISEFRETNYTPRADGEQNEYNTVQINVPTTDGEENANISETAEDQAPQTASVPDVWQVIIPRALNNEYGIAARSINAILEYVTIGQRHVKYLLSTLTEDERETVKAIMKKKIKSNTVVNDVCWTIDTTDDEEHPYFLRNLLTVQESKMLLALQKCLSDQTDNIHGLIEDGRKCRKGRKKKTDSKELATVQKTEALGRNVEEFSETIQKAIKDTNFKQFGVIAISPSDFLRDYLGVKKAAPEDKKALDDFLNKLHSGRFAVIEKGKDGKKAKALTVQKDLLYWHTENGKYIIVLGDLFCSLVNNFMRLPENQAEILNAIGKSLVKYNIYLMILQEMSYNEPGVKIRNRKLCRRVLKSEQHLLHKFFRVTDDRKNCVKLEAIYNAFNMFYNDFKLLCKPVEKIQLNGECYVEFYVNRGVFDKRKNKKDATE